MCLIADSRTLAARSEGLLHFGLKCPGPERVVGGLVLGTQVCPRSAIISFETGAFYRVHASNHIGLKCRCAPCNGRFIFNEFLRRNFLERDAQQIFCSNQHCISTVWEGSKFCRKHFLTWKPGLPGEEERKELKALFEEASLVQWHPETDAMAEVMKRIEGQPKVPASQVANIDLEFTFFSREVLQIGIADMEGNNVLDCLPRYGEGIVAPSSKNHLPAPPTWGQLAQKQKIQAYFTQDGTLDAQGVVRKLQESGISQDTMFLSWASWPFDLAYLRDWLEQEGFHDILPGNENVCLLYHEFRVNLERIIGRTCHRGKAFPLRLPVVFPLLFGEEDPLSGKNHHALIDSKQLCRMAKLFMDLCKPPGQRLGIDKLRSGKRQRKIEEFLSSVSLNKRPKSS